MTEKEQFEAWCKDYFDCHSESFNLEPQFGYYNSVSSKTFYGEKAARYSDVWMLFKTWQACAEQKDKEIDWLKECVTVSNNDTKYYRDRLGEAEKEIETLHDRLAMVIGQRDEERLAR